MGGQVVDTLTAEEFMQQVLQKVSQDELRAIGDAASRKADRFGALFGDAATTPSEDALRWAFAHMFGMRKKGVALVAGLGAEAVGVLVGNLLHGDAPLPERFDTFAGGLAGFEDIATDLASEFLHFTAPDRYWLWSRWMWDPRTETGALRLVTMDEFDLYGPTPGQTYLKVGEAIAFVDETGRAVGFTALGAPSFGIDVFLACVYGIYMYTVLRMRMTQEFNHVVPQLPELARRLLGVWTMEA